MSACKDMKEAEDFIYSSYLRAEKYIPKADDSITRKPALTRELLDRIGKPDASMKIILVTGSKGKGSTSRFISSLLANFGYKVGLFTSPHLVNFNERIRINGKAISDYDFVRLCNDIAPSMYEIEEKLPESEYQGPVGIALAVALRYYHEQNVDYAVIETGRGGRYDDTNVLENDWAVITPIFKEHIMNLGPTLQDIVKHKIGIVKRNTKEVFFNRQSEEVKEYIHEMWNVRTTKAYYFGEQFVSKNVTMDKQGTHFDVVTEKAHYTNLCFPLLGAFQADNAATAIKVCESIIAKPIEETIVKQTFSTIQWPGRCEIIDKNPTVILDGAINAESTEYVRELMRTIGGKNVVSIIGVPADKDYEGVIRVASTFSSHLIISRPEHSHKLFPDDGLKVAEKYSQGKSIETETLTEAIKIAKSYINVDAILIIGTQTFIGNAKKIWNHSLLDIGK
jgi:dihydrofolate synthase/folylpolyglutamate synthase